MTRAFLRFIYRLILDLHPAPFQHRFGGEMLWIFDEESKRGNVARLFFDGTLSLLRQRCTIQRKPPQAFTGFGSLIVESGPGPVRILQAALLAAMFFASFILLVELTSRLSSTIERPQSVVRCIFTLQAAPRVASLPNPLKALR